MKLFTSWCDHCSLFELNCSVQFASVPLKYRRKACSQAPLLIWGLQPRRCRPENYGRPLGAGLAEWKEQLFLQMVEGSWIHEQTSYKSLINFMKLNKLLVNLLISVRSLPLSRSYPCFCFRRDNRGYKVPFKYMRKFLECFMITIRTLRRLILT
jgi:hypothetical protein